MKILGMVSSLLLVQTIAAQALSPESVSNLACSQVTQAGVARQPWSAGGAPYGAPLIEWKGQEFSLLRGRIADCARQTGTDVRGLLAYVQRLEEITRLQNAQSIAAAEPRQRPGTNPDLGAQRNARSTEDRQRRQNAYDRFVQRRDHEIEADSRAAAHERELVAKVRIFETQDELKSFCNDIFQSQLSQSTRYSVASECKRRLEVMAFADQQRAETPQAEASAKLLPDLIQKLKQMPDDDETLRHLQDLRSDNHYRLKSLTYRDQNNYYNAIGSRLEAINTKRLDAKCATVVSKIPVPTEIRDAIILDGLSGVSLTYFLCGPVLTTRNVSVALGPNDAVDIKVDSSTLTFARRRYLSDRKAEVSINSPIQGGVNALVLTSATDGANRLADGNPNLFVINFYSQFTPQVATFLAQ